MELIRKFEQLSKNDANIAGGKGASLGEMTQAGIPVPPGFVVLTHAFEQFLEEEDLKAEIEAILSTVHQGQMHSVEHASEKIQGLIKSAEVPQDIAKEIFSNFDALGAQYVAVRSSATAEDGAAAAWAGQLDTFLNTTRATLVEKVLHCWASLFTPRAIFYRIEKGMRYEAVSVAVVVQKMVQSEVSGIAFSVHPVTEDYNQLIIESGYGLGEAIVSGQVTPDSFVVAKRPRHIIDTNISQQTKGLYRSTGGGNEWRELGAHGSAASLNEPQVLKLAEEIIRIENLYGFPCDIEWAFEGGQFYITQSRPITTLSHSEKTVRTNFEKVYSRDTTLIIQQAWCTTLEKHRDELGLDAYRDKILTLHHLYDGVIEIWENTTWTPSLMEAMLKKNQESDAVFTGHIVRHKKMLEYLEPKWQKGAVDSIDELTEVVDVVFDSMNDFDWLYYPAMDERTPAGIRERAVAMREKDVYFDETDKLVRKSITKLYPELKGYEQTILRKELRNPPALEVLKKRKQHFVIVGEHTAFDGSLEEFQVANPIYQFHIERAPQGTRELTGQTGNSGTGTGRVRILKRKEQVDDLLEGEILVSTMTTPDFIPAMKRAAAIVTDEGGITCHAAIFSREVGTPCLIGTKFATELLHDGDLVEVDATTGIVRLVASTARELKREDINFEEWEYEFQQRGEQPISLCDFFCRAFATRVRADLTGEQEPVNYLFTDSSKGYSNPAMTQRTIDILRTKTEDHAELQDILRNSIDVPRGLSASADTLNALTVSDTTNVELVRLWKQMDEAFVRTIPWFYYPWYLSRENILTDRVKAELEKHRVEIEKLCDFEDALRVLVFPTKKTAFQLEQDEMLGLVEIAEKDANFANTDAFKTAAQEYLKKYDWLTTFMLAPQRTMTEGQLIERVQRAVKENFKETMALQHAATQKNEDLAVRLVDVLKSDTSLMLRIADARELAYVLTAGVEESYVASARHLPFMEVVAKRIGVEYTELKYLLSDEVVSALEGATHIPTALLEERKKGFVMMVRGGRKMALYGDAGHQLSGEIDAHFSKVDTSISELRGQMACKGRATGKVRVALSPDDAHALEPGEILVTPMTNPDYVPAMRRSGAIVTDEGGLLSHAAIMSREFNKPCVIATKIATKLLKDGDTVEVDATNGIVRKLSV